MKLAAKIVLVSVIAVVAVMTASNFYAAHFTFLRLKRNHQRYAEKMADQMEAAMVKAWRQGGLDAMEEQLCLQPNQPIARWVWFEETVTETTRPCADADFSQIITRKQTVSFVVTTGDGSRNLYTYHPVDLGNSRNGGLEFSQTLDEHDRETMEDFLEFLIAVGSMAVVSILVVWIAGVRMIGRPLNQLADIANRIGQGDLSGRLNLKGKDELSQLATAINAMSQRLQDQKQVIENETNVKIEVMKQLRHADRLKTVGRMAASIAHEIGTPLSVVSGRAALIAKGSLSQEKIQQNAETIQGETERIAGMIRQSLDYARQSPTEKSPVDLNEALIQATELLKPVAERHLVRFKVALADQRAMSFVDASQIHQVVTNLVMNGIQAMPEGGELELGLTQQEATVNASPAEYWVITVTDQGSGIPAENLESIFEPFFTTKDVGKGTGLGLSIAYSIVQEQGGWIEVESEVGKGSQFQVFLPVLSG
jgi:two-component system NtrC family sensor kinase